METMETLKMPLDAWRRARKISQGEMARQLDVHVGTYQNWEKAPEKISIGNAEKISEILHVSLNEILF